MNFLLLKPNTGDFFSRRSKIPKDQKVIVGLIFVVEVHCIIVSSWERLGTVLYNLWVGLYPSPPWFNLWNSKLENGDENVVHVGNILNVKVRFDERD